MIDFEKMTADERSKFVTKAVQDFVNGNRMKEAVERRAYYETENPDINKRTKMFAAAIDDGADIPKAVAKENKFAANEKVASSFFRDITDAKVQYLAGEGADVNAVAEEDAAAVDAIAAPIALQLKRTGQECLTDALVYSCGYSYMQVLNGAISLKSVPYCEVMPFYDKYGALANVLRYWKRGGEEYAEWHTAAKVYAFERGAKGGDFEQKEERPQIVTATVYGDGSAEVTGGKAWARIPWFEMQHNNGKTSSLTNSAKSMIRCYDIVVSDFANNLIDVQDVFIKLKDTYGSGMEWGEVLELARNFKAADGIEGVETVSVPYEARKVLADMLRSGIYSALRGVDTNGIATGGVTLATSIRALYADVDLWADLAQWHLSDWVREVLCLVADYAGVTLPPVNVTFTRRMIFDESAQMDAIARQKGVISDKTLFENHPLVQDAQAELERIASQEYDPAFSSEV